MAALGRYPRLARRAIVDHATEPDQVAFGLDLQVYADIGIVPCGLLLRAQHQNPAAGLGLPFDFSPHIAVETIDGLETARITAVGGAAGFSKAQIVEILG